MTRFFWSQYQNQNKQTPPPLEMTTPSFSESIYAVLPDEGVVMVEARDATSDTGCALAGWVLLIVSLSLIVFLVVRLATGHNGFFASPPSLSSSSPPPPPATSAAVSLASPADLAALRATSVREGRNLCVLAYSSQCGHCTAFLPVWKQAAATPSGTTFAQFEVGSQWKEVMDKHKIDGVPTMLLFAPKGDEVRTFEDKRTVEAVQRFASSSH